MKALINLIIATLLTGNLVNAQAPFELSYDTSDPTHTVSEVLDANGYDFSILSTDINTKYDEIPSGFFMNKFLMVSSKKIGGLSKIDAQTNQPYTNLYCLDIKKSGQLDRPLLFSRKLVGKGNTGQVAFSPDEKTMYYTKSNEHNSKNYQLYSATLEVGSIGNWINETLIYVSKETHSVENPYVSADGTKLYFSSNIPGSIGGFDLYVAPIRKDGSIGDYKNLGDSINTVEDDKFPTLSADGKNLYFSSKGHATIGGFDVFVSRIIGDTYKAPRNLGSKVNTSADEIAFVLANNKEGYVSSNKSNGKGSFDIYKFNMDNVEQTLEGLVVDKETQIPLSNTVVVLFDEEGNEVDRQFTDSDAHFNFDVIAFDTYKVIAQKDGFKDLEISFTSTFGTSKKYISIIELSPTQAEIVEVDNKLMIDIENIYFDYNKWNIKQESTISLNKVVEVLKTIPEMRIEINAHTDNRGKELYNLSLSEKRAASAMQYIISKGIDANRLIAHGYGETQPLIDCNKECTKEQYDTNRRIEFVILK